MDSNCIIQGSCEEVLKTLPDESINCSISSPPYWALRDYGVEGQLGLEPTFEEYIDKLCTIYGEIKRVLRKDGTCFVNLGDTYGGTATQRSSGGRAGFADNIDKGKQIDKGMKEKSLCLIPQRFAIEMVNRGWILRNVIIWHKPNPMPSSAKDRFTVDFEYVFFFVKNKRYWFEPQYEPNLTESNVERPRMGQGKNTIYKQKRNDYKKHTMRSVHGEDTDIDYRNPLGRNKRTVWTIPTQPYSEAHFATFPEKLIEPMILSGCPEFICKKCGKAREKIYEPSAEYKKLLENQYKVSKAEEKEIAAKTGKFGSASRIETYFNNMPAVTKDYLFKGYTDCGCNAGWRPGVMLDPFVVRARPVWSLPKTEGTGLVLN